MVFFNFPFTKQLIYARLLKRSYSNQERRKLDKIEMRVKCPNASCNRCFTLRVSRRYEGKRMRVECPGCVGMFLARIVDRALIQHASHDRDPELDGEPEFENAFEALSDFANFTKGSARALLEELKREFDV